MMEPCATKPVRMFVPCQCQHVMKLSAWAAIPNLLFRVCMIKQTLFVPAKRVISHQTVILKHMASDITLTVHCLVVHHTHCTL